MKIRTIIGVLLVLALVLGSTGIVIAEPGDGDGDGPAQDQDRDDWIDTDDDGIPDSPPGDGDGICDN